MIKINKAWMFLIYITNSVQANKNKQQINLDVKSD